MRLRGGVTAWTAGIRYFDAARSYGGPKPFCLNGDSTACRPQRSSLVQWGYTYTAGWKVDAEKHEVKDHSLVTYAAKSRKAVLSSVPT